MNIHPYANLIPEMSTEEFDRLLADIQANGLLEPIVTFENAILDGRHRYWACLQTKPKTEPRFEEYRGDSPLAYVVSKNVARRNLTPAQLGALATDLLPELEKEAAGRNQYTGPVVPPPEPGGSTPKERESTARAAKQVGASREAVQVAKKARTEKPEVFEKMRAGEITVAEAHRELHPPKPKPKTPAEKKDASGDSLGSIIAGLTWDQAASKAKQAISQLAEISQTLRMSDVEQREDSLQMVDAMIADLQWVRSLIAGETEVSIEMLEGGEN